MGIIDYIKKAFSASPQELQTRNIKHPGIRGGKFHRTQRGAVIYGSSPTGKQAGGSQKVVQPSLFNKKQQEPPKPANGTEVSFNHNGKDLSGFVTASGQHGATVRDQEGKQYQIRWENMSKIGKSPEKDLHPGRSKGLKVGGHIFFGQGKEKGEGTITAIGRKGVLVRNEKGEKTSVPYDKIKARQRYLDEFIKEN